MARIRTVKPEFFTSLTIGDLSLEQRLTFIGLWTHADDEGRCVDSPELIKAALWPLDKRTAEDVADDLRALTEASLIVQYSLNRRRYLAISGWSEHQRINRPTPSKFPSPEEGEITPPEPPTSRYDTSLRIHGVLSEDSPPERKGKEGNREGKGTKDGERAATGDELPLGMVEVAETAAPPGAQKKIRKKAEPKENPHQLADDLTVAFWERYKTTTAQSFIAVRQILRGAIGNGMDRDDLARAIDLLGKEGRAISGGTITTALGQIRAPRLRAVPGGYTPWTNPTDQNEYDGAL